MREKSEIDNLFRTRLQDMQMEVESGFWETLEQDLERRPLPMLPARARWFRWVAAASVLLLLGGISVWLSLPSPSENAETVLAHKAPVLADPVSVPPSLSAPLPKASRVGADIPAQELEENAPVSVHVSISITQTQQYGSRRRPHARCNHLASEGNVSSTSSATASGHSRREDAVAAASFRPSSPWAVKALVGTSLPGSDYAAPLTAGVLVERSLGKRFSLETGLQYSRLEDGAGESLHSLGIPLRVNMLLASNRRLDFYAQAGASVEKVVSEASSPVQAAVQAGVGLRYKMTDRLALFAEPSVSHHFDSDSSPRTLRTERPVNLNLLCGLRMTY